MTTILLIRHGESTANLNNIFAGHFNPDLTQRGQTQAACTARFIADTYKVDAIYSSDLRRAVQTAIPLGNLLQLPINPCDGLREIFAGEWEGQLFYQLKNTHPDAFSVWINDIGNARCPGGESTAELYDRIYQTVLQIAAEHDGQTVAIFTHATPIRCLRCRLSGVPIARMQHLPWESNASVAELAYENGMLRAVCFGQDDHLADLRTFLPADTV